MFGSVQIVDGPLCFLEGISSYERAAATHSLPAGVRFKESRDGNLGPFFRWFLLPEPALPG